MNDRNVLRDLAEVYSQLYLKPGGPGEALYPEVVLRGRPVPEKDLSHFRGADGDSCVYEDTPAGPVRVVTLADRGDFETFLQIMAERCKPVPIPRTQGASILDGVINRGRIAEFQKKMAAEGLDAGAMQDFLKNRANYTDALIVLSVGPYSSVPAEKAGFPEDVWLKHSQTIRRYHECTHFVCRRLYRPLIDPVWDELVADAVGIRAALGRYDVRLAETVLGLDGERYVGGRLENYLPEGTSIDALAKRCHAVIENIAHVSESRPDSDPFALAFALEERKGPLWDESIQ